MNAAEIHSAPVSNPPPASSQGPKPPRRSPRSKLLIGGLVALALAAIVGVKLTNGSQSEAAASPAVARDVPTLEGNKITFSAAFAERAGLKTAKVERGAMTPVLRLVGTVSFDPAHVAAVGSRIQGFVRMVPKVEGDFVQAGDVLAEIESSELGQAQADVVAAQANQKAAKLNAEREADLRTRNLTTAREEEVARATLDQQNAMLAAARQRVVALGGKAPGNTFGVHVVRAPIKGTVVERLIAPGQSVEANLTAFRVADLDRLWIELSVFERDIGAVRVGDKVEISSLSDGDRKLEGHVAHVGEVVHQQTRTAEIRVAIDNTERLVKPGQSVTAEVRASGRQRDALLIPKGAMTYIDGKAMVFVADGDKYAVPTEVKLGVSDDTRVEVIEGLNEGMSVYSEGVFSLKSELFR